MTPTTFVTLATVPVGLQIAGVAVGALAALLAVAVVGAHALLRRRYAGKNALVALGGQRVVIVLAALMVVTGGAMGVSSSDGVGIIGVIVLGLLGMGLLLFRLSAISYVADETGFTRYLFTFKKTLPWAEIDWVYPIRKTTTTYTPVGVKMSAMTENFWAIEAGRRRRIRVQTDYPGAITAAAFAPFLKRIGEHVPPTQWGYSRRAAVQAARKAQKAARKTPTTGQTS